MQTHSYLSFYFWLMFFRTIRSHLLDRWSYLSLCSCVLKLGSQCLRGPWMRQILYQSQIYSVMPWLLILELTHFSPQTLGLLLTWTSATCFPYMWIVYLDYHFPASFSLWDDSWLLPVGIPFFVLFLGSSNYMLLALLDWRLAFLSWRWILTCPCIIDGLSV